MARSDVDAFVQEIKPPAYWRAKGSTKEVPLTQFFRPLHSGESVRCGPGGHLKIVVNGVVFAIAPSPDWFMIHPTVNRALLSQAVDLLSHQVAEQVIKMYGQRGGLSR